MLDTIHHPKMATLTMFFSTLMSFQTCVFIYIYVFLTSNIPVLFTFNSGPYNFCKIFQLLFLSYTWSIWLVRNISTHLRNYDSTSEEFTQISKE